MKNLSGKDKLILACLAVIGIFFVYYELFINPMTKKISETKISIVDKEIKAEELKTMDNENKKLQREVAKLSEQYETDKRKLPIDIRDPEIQKDLHTLAQKNEAKVNSMTFDDMVPFEDTKNKVTNVKKQNVQAIQKGQLMMIPVNLTFNGNYTKIINLIKNIEEADRISELQSINVTKAREGGVDANVIVNYYFISGDEEDKKGLKYAFTQLFKGRLDLFNK